MRQSEFRAAVDEVLGVAYGRSIVTDLVLPGIGYRTAEQALGEGEPPQLVWDAVCEELDLGERARWHHRMDSASRKRPAN